MYLGLSFHTTYIDTAVHLGGGEFVLAAEIKLAALTRRDIGAAITSLKAHIRPYGPVTAIGALYAPDIALVDQQADRLTLTLQAALNAPAHIATPAEALGLYEARFGVAADSPLTCCHYLDRRLSGSICLAIACGAVPTGLSVDGDICHWLLRLRKNKPRRPANAAERGALRDLYRQQRLRLPITGQLAFPSTSVLLPAPTGRILSPAVSYRFWMTGLAAPQHRLSICLTLR
jgi:hypothetical protein